MWQEKVSNALNELLHIFELDIKTNSSVNYGMCYNLMSITATPEELKDWKELNTIGNICYNLLEQTAKEMGVTTIEETKHWWPLDDIDSRIECIQKTIKKYELVRSR